MAKQRNGRVRRDPPRGRLRAFRVIAVIMAASAVAFGLFTAVFGVVSEAQEIHAYHNVIVASLLLVLSAPPAIAATRAPARAAPHLLSLAALSIAALVTMAIAVMVDVFTLPVVALVVVLLLLRVPRESAAGPGRPSIPLSILVALTAVPLFAYAIDQAGLQRVDATSEHAAFNHWVEVAFYSAAIPLLGALAAFRPPVFRLAGWTSGTALAIMGGGSLLLQGYASALDQPWAWAALAAGPLLVLLVEWEARRRAGAPSERRPAT